MQLTDLARPQPYQHSVIYMNYVLITRVTCLLVPLYRGTWHRHHMYNNMHVCIAVYLGVYVQSDRQETEFGIVAKFYSFTCRVYTHTDS